MTRRGGGSGGGRGRDPEGVDEELAFHVAMRVEALVREGLPEGEARRRVLEEAGDLARARSYCVRQDRAASRARRRREALAGWGTELRLGLRAVVRRPGSAAVAVAVLAAAVALNALVFTVVRGVLLAPLPLPDAGRVLLLAERPVGGEGGGASLPALARWREGARSLEGAVGWLPTSLPLAGGAEPTWIDGALVTEGFLDFTGAPVLAGRTLGPGDHAPGAEPALVLSEALWTSAFGRDREIVGRTVELDERPYRVVGVVGGAPWPESARFWVPTEARNPELGEVWGARIFTVLGRLRPGMAPDGDVGAAEAELTGLLEDIPDAAGFTVSATPLQEGLVQGVRTPLLLLQLAVAAVLLVAAGNVGILLLARGLHHRGALAVRKALGADPARLAVSGLAEAATLAVAAGLLGLLAAAALLSPTLALVPGDLPRASDVGLSPGVVLFALGLSTLTGLAAGLLPALEGVRTPAARVLGEAGSSRVGSRWARRARGALVTSQVTASVVLLAVAGVLLRSFVETVRQDPGFRADGVVAFDLLLPAGRYDAPGSRTAFVEALLERLVSGGVADGAAVGRNLPISGSSMASPVEIEGLGQSPEAAQVAWVTPGYFEVMGIPLRGGRAFASSDGPEAEPVAVVDDAFARRFLGGREAVGLRVRSFFGGGGLRDVVGTVGGVRHRGLTIEPSPVLYEAFFQAPATGFTLLVRSGRSTGDVVAGVREALRDLDPGVVPRGAATLHERLGRSVAAPRFYALVLGVFAAVTLLLAAAGTYSVLSHGVVERRREIGLRMALGARAGTVRALVVREALRLTAAGLVLGGVGALAATRAVAGLLYRVGPADPGVLVALPVVVALGAAAAAWLPARRATEVDPARTLVEP